MVSVGVATVLACVTDDVGTGITGEGQLIEKFGGVIIFIQIVAARFSVCTCFLSVRRLYTDSLAPSARRFPLAPSRNFVWILAQLSPFDFGGVRITWSQQRSYSCSERLDRSTVREWDLRRVDPVRHTFTFPFLLRLHLIPDAS